MLVRIKSEPQPTQEQAEQWRDEYYSRWHPWGYGTSLYIDQTSDGFIVEGTRYDSCE